MGIQQLTLGLAGVIATAAAGQAMGQSTTVPVSGSYFDGQVFDPADYLRNHRAFGIGSGDYVTLAQMRMHWINHGMAVGWAGSDAFDPVRYVRDHPDLHPFLGCRPPITSSSRCDWAGAIKHYLTHGIAEGRGEAARRRSGAPKWDTNAFWPTNSMDGNAIVGGSSGGSPIMLRSESRYAGAISSLQWKGREFINTGPSGSKGRLLQYAYQINGQGECYNPTEAGSRHDGNAPTTTSRCKLSWGAAASGRAPATLVTMVEPSYWISAFYRDAENSPAQNHCNGHATVGNGAQLFAANQMITKRVTIAPRVGGAQFRDVVEFLGDVTIADRGIQSIRFEAPTGHLTGFFTNAYVYDTARGDLIPIGNGGHQTLPPIYASADGGYAMGVYTPDLPSADEWEPGYQLSYYAPPAATPDADPTTPEAETTSKWTLVYKPPVNPDGVYTFRGYLVLGTLASVQATMGKLAAALPPAQAAAEFLADDALPGYSEDDDGRSRWETFAARDPRHAPYNGRLRFAPARGDRDLAILGVGPGTLQDPGRDRLPRQPHGHGGPVRGSARRGPLHRP